MASSSVNDLPTFYKQLAKKSVNENPSHIAAHLAALKRWIQASPHLRVPDNDVFLLSFLRYAHYDHSVAQKRLDNYCSIRCSPKYELCDWFRYPKLSDPMVDLYLNMGLCVPCGVIDSGVFILIMRLSAWNPDVMPALDMRIMNNMNFEMLLFDQCKQIGGFGLIIDMSSISIKQANEWNDRKFVKGSFKLMQEASPGRTKHLIFYKENKLFDIAFKFAELWMSDKMRDRIIRVKDDMTKAFKKLPGLANVLPAEYGGKNGTIKDLIDNNRREFEAFYSKGYPLAGMSVDESLRPAYAKDYMREYKDSDAPSMGNKGTFIRIDPGD